MTHTEEIEAGTDVASGAGPEADNRNGGHRGPSSSPNLLRRASRILGQHRTAARRSLIAVLGFLVAGLVLPAATKQWADRSQELELKQNLVARVAESSTGAILSSVCIVRQCFPEAVGAALFPGEDATRAFEAYVAGQREIVETNREWATTKAGIGSLLTAHFPDSDLRARWDSYADAVTAFTSLSTSNCGAVRERDTALLRAQLPGLPAGTWDDLLRDLGPSCQLTPPAFASAYALVADELLRERDRVNQQILEANPVGYSSGLADFLRDLYPL